ncbi:MAG: hypothetical protein HY005_00660 [Candidatus Staskawiczbacteria bacterium]|nr:hypothetical protein [Candidatus Staskawiczbacteria bacterium]
MDFATASRTTAIALTAFGSDSDKRRLAEVPNEPFTGDLERVSQILRILLITQPEVRKVMQVATEDLLAVSDVGTSVQDVRMPDGIDLVRGHDVFVGVDRAESKETFVPQFSCDSFFLRPTLTFLLKRETELHLDHRKVKIINLLDRCLVLSTRFV